MIDIIQELKNLKKHLDDGTITQSQFDKLKQIILDEKPSKIEAISTYKALLIKFLDEKISDLTPPKQTPPLEVLDDLENEAPASIKEDKPTYQKDEKKKKSLLLPLAGGMVVLGVILMYFLFFTSEPPEIGKEVEAPKIIKYVLSSKLNLAKEPGEESDIITEIPFGEKVEILNEKEIKIGDYFYAEAYYRGDIGWITTKAKTINLIDDENKLTEINNIFTGNWAQEILETMPAYAKYAILDLKNRGTYGNFNVNLDRNDEYSTIEFFRSRLANRNSSKDKKQDINNEPKDMAFIAKTESNKQILLIMKFDRDFNWEIILENRDDNSNINGFKRVNRKSKIEYYDIYDLVELPLEYDALLVDRNSDGNFYLYDPNGSFDYYFFYTEMEEVGC